MKSTLKRFRTMLLLVIAIATFAYFEFVTEVTKYKVISNILG